MDVNFGDHSFIVSETGNILTISLEGLLVYKFRRTENGCIRKPENISYSRALHEWLDNRYGIVQETVNIKGTEVTCDCDSPELQKDHDWSDGMASHFWYRCRNCDTRGAVATDHEGNITSADPFVTVREKQEA